MVVVKTDIHVVSHLLAGLGIARLGLGSASGIVCAATGVGHVGVLVKHWLCCYCGKPSQLKLEVEWFEKIEGGA